ncbi:transporter [Ganoderma sinense ZZ0214-1]|uniref:laccase n=1 Tax=Ganoderma sinense ZZ0214-1 TaxID=1077348 RepID=A0A2G8S7H3_9APHY|nr:transporter [Ganoderma sinense ZZ0214-1]
MAKAPIFAALAAFVQLVAGSIGPIADLTISDADISPDGYTRAAVVMNGQFPGPLIVGNKGDNFQLNVINDLDNTTMLTATTVHWHGFFQQGTNYADGVAMITQCPISIDNSFLYDFTATDQAGTFWYHSHLSTQYCDGLRGPMVVYDPDDPHASLYDVDDETTVITLSDWYHTAARLGNRFPGGADSTLFNGLGRFAGGDSSDLAVFNVTQGQRYRFRLVSMSCDPNFTFSIDGHNMTVIEADAVNHEAVVVDSIQIFAGQRYSFVLTADQDVDNYWMRALPNIGTTTFDGGVNSAILRYSGADDIEPTTNETTSVLALNETDLVPLENLVAPGTAEVGGVDYALNLDFGFNGTEFFINDVAFVSPSVPALLQILSGTVAAADLLPSGSYYSLPSNSSHTFYVVRSAGQTDYNYENPPQRDVVSVGDTGDNVTIRFTTDNPGPWFLHCHIDFHLEAGFAIVLVEDTDEISASVTPTTAWEDLCPIYASAYPSGLTKKKRRHAHRRSLDASF